MIFIPNEKGKIESTDKLIIMVLEHALIFSEELTANFIVDLIDNEVLFTDNFKESEIKNALKVWHTIKQENKVYFVRECLVKLERDGFITENIKSSKSKGKRYRITTYKKNIGKSFADRYTQKTNE